VRLGIDMDEVLTDTLGKQLRVYNAHFGTDVPAERLDGFELVDIVPPEQRPFVSGMMHEPGFFADLEPIEGALEAMEQICRMHQVYIVSAATEFPGSFQDKLCWLERYLPQIPTRRIIFCGEKSVLDLDCLVDDTPSHFEGFRGTGLLFDAPHNRKESGFRRVRGWKQTEAEIASLAECLQRQ